MSGLEFFGEDVAASYDDSVSSMFAPSALDDAVSLLQNLASDGGALEFGVGTGRVALPLAGRSVPVHGIDLSEAMVAQLRAKPGADAVEVTIGDFSTTRVDGKFALVYLVFNTIMNLTTQAAQVECFRNAAAHLQPHGCFVIECEVPRLRLLPPGQSAIPFEIGAQGWAFDVYEPATQAMSSNYVTFDGGRASHASTPFRYVWPSELDLMAQLAGLSLRERWGDWDGEEFTAESSKHVSVWEKLVSGQEGPARDPTAAR